MKKRLFFALNASDPLEKTFLPFYKKLRIIADKKEMVMKWVPLENFHATITFVGPMDVEVIPRLTESLEKICARFAPFDLKVEDVGAFSSEQDARALWLGVQNKKYLNEFKTALENELSENSLLPQPEQRDYTPHITFARLRNPKSVKDMLSPFKRKSFGKIHVTEIILYESEVRGAYTVYKPIARSRLTGTLPSAMDDADFLATGNES